MNLVLIWDLGKDLETKTQCHIKEERDIRGSKPSEYPTMGPDTGGGGGEEQK